jgi:hypothetical protein
MNNKRAMYGLRLDVRPSPHQRPEYARSGALSTDAHSAGPSLVTMCCCGPLFLPPLRFVSPLSACGDCVYFGGARSGEEALPGPFDRPSTGRSWPETAGLFAVQRWTRGCRRVGASERASVLIIRVARSTCCQCCPLACAQFVAAAAGPQLLSIIGICRYRSGGKCLKPPAFGLWLVACAAR